MDCKLIWTEPAITDLQSLVAYIARDDRARALAIGNSLLGHVEILTQFPYIGPVYETQGSVPTRVIVCPPYLIHYRVLPEQNIVEIMHIRHGRQQTP